MFFMIIFNGCGNIFFPFFPRFFLAVLQSAKVAIFLAGLSPSETEVTTYVSTSLLTIISRQKNDVYADLTQKYSLNDTFS